MKKLSVVIITYNEEKNIERCLRSLQWADEIVVVDSFSTDRTVEIARRFASNVIQHEFDGDIPQRLRGFAAATGDWLMYVDADEEVSAALKSEILVVIADRAAKDGYLIPRRVMIFGKWVLHGGWYPDYTLRLFRRDKYIAESAEVHGGFKVRGETGKLKGELFHYTYDSIDQYLSKMNDYTSLQISSKLKDVSGREPLWPKLIFSPVSHFFRKYVSNKGYKDGFHGFILAALGAIYTLALYAKLWEYRWREREGKALLPPITNLEVRRLGRL